MLKLALNSEIIKGIRIGEEQILNLQYADDTLFFLEASISNAINLKKILCLFELASGLKINYHKSSVTGFGINNELEEGLCRILGCRKETLPIKYLGFPLTHYSSRLEHWAPILDKMNRKMDTWHAKHLSWGGRLTMIKHVISSIPVYFLSVLKMPQKILKQIDKLRKSFFWRGNQVDKKGYNLMKWERLTRPIKNDGLGILELDTFSTSLKATHIWDFLCKKEQLWIRIVKNKYCRFQSDIEALLNRNPNIVSPFWRELIRITPVFMPRCHVLIGNGKNTSLWNMVWNGQSPFKNQFPDLYDVAGRKFITVHEYQNILESNNMFDYFGMDLNIALQRFICFNDKCKVRLMEREDVLVWQLAANKKFSIKSFYNFLIDSGVRTTTMEIIWNSQIPMRNKKFSWLVSHGNFLTKDIMRKRKWAGDLTCVLCKKEEESILHLFCKCDFIKSFWSFVLQDRMFFETNSLHGGIFNVKFRNSLKMSKTELYTLLHACIWQVWLERNNRFFRKSSCSNVQVIRKAFELAEIWARDIYRSKSNCFNFNLTYMEWYTFHTGYIAGLMNAGVDDVATSNPVDEEMTIGEC